LISSTVELSEVELTLSVVTFDIHLRSPKSPPKLLLNPVPLPPTISIPHPKQQMAQQMMGLNQQPPQPDPPIAPRINSPMNSPAPSPMVRKRDILLFVCMFLFKFFYIRWAFPLLRQVMGLRYPCRNLIKGVSRMNAVVKAMVNIK
jgi:hypothetical protein